MDKLQVDSLYQLGMQSGKMDIYLTINKDFILEAETEEERVGSTLNPINIQR